METGACDILLIEDSPSDRDLLEYALRQPRDATYRLRHAATLGGGLSLLAKRGPDVVLLDLNLPDSAGMDTARRFCREAPDVPVIVLTGLGDEEMGLEALRGGAQDFLIKGEFDGWSIWRTIRYAIERHRAHRAFGEIRFALGMEAAQPGASLTDTATDIQAEVARRLRAERMLQSANEALRLRAAELRRLAVQLAHAEQREQQRMARVLHDDLQQLLCAARLHLEALTKQADVKAVARLGQSIDEMLGQCLSVTRSLVGQLAPPLLKDQGLKAAIAWLGAKMEDLHGLKVVLDDRTGAPCLNGDIRAVLYGCVRELLFNVVKHAKVSTASVRLERTADRFRAEVSDAGAGFDPASVSGDRESGGFGLREIRERVAVLGGSMEVTSAPGRGSRFLLSVPID